MLKPLKNLFLKFYNKEVEGTGLAIFRIFYCLVLLGEISQMFYFRHLIFDAVPFLNTPEINFAIPIGIWFLSVVFILFGAFTKYAAILNYIMSLIMIGSIRNFEYHVFYAYMGTNFLLIFTPVSQVFSIDRLFEKLKYSSTKFNYTPPTKVRQIHYFTIPYVAVGMIYFDSIFQKLATDMWLNGLGVWLPSSLPMFTQFNFTVLLNMEFVVKLLSWLTIILETLYIFVFFRKNFRIPVLILGVGLHLGILLQFPIPWFGLTMLSFYIPLIPLKFWEKIFNFSKDKPSLYFYYDVDCPLCNRTKNIIMHLDWFNKIKFKTAQFDASENPALEKFSQDQLLDNIYSTDKNGNVFVGVDTYRQVLKRIFYLYPFYILLSLPGFYHLAKKIYAFVAENRETERCSEETCGFNPPEIYSDDQIKLLKNFTLSDFKRNFLFYFLLSITTFQVVILYQSEMAIIVKKKYGFNNTIADELLKNITLVTKTTLGLTAHNVFIDRIHFSGYNHEVAITYIDKNNKEIWLPIINEIGHPGAYNTGPNWAFWSFRACSAYIQQYQLETGIMKFTAFWASKNNIDLKNAKFNIKVKRLEMPSQWQYDFLNKQIAKPWVDGGFIEWKDKTFHSNVKDIESI